MSAVRTALGKRMGSRLIQLLIGLKTEWKFNEIYGDFASHRSFRSKTVEGLPQESGKVHGTIIEFLGSLDRPVNRVLLAGDGNEAKPVYSRMLNLDPSRIITAGIMPGMDMRWDYEQMPEGLGTFDCIVSQSMLEHLIDPYKHVKDCISLLNKGGVLIIHTMMPGFNYHRHPVDCLRFYPDWFEEIAKRHGLAIVRKHIRNCRITYALKR